MLPRAERLTRTGLFQRLHSARKAVSTALLTLYVLERQGKGNSRLPLTGFVVGKKVHLRATKRNRVKRRLREAYRRFCAEIANSDKSDTYSLEQWYALVWHVKPEAMEVPFEEISRSVAECLEKAARRYGRPVKSKRG